MAPAFDIEPNLQKKKKQILFIIAIRIVIYLSAKITVYFE